MLRKYPVTGSEIGWGVGGGVEETWNLCGPFRAFHHPLFLQGPEVRGYPPPPLDRNCL